MRAVRLKKWKRDQLKDRLMCGRSAVQCHYCGRWLYRHDVTLDHVIAHSRGGSNELSNLLLCCAGCNRSKGAMPYQDFVSKVAA